MNRSVLILGLAASVAAAQTTSPATPKTATTPRPHTATAATATKLPPGIPVVHALTRTAFALRYQDIKVGTGPEAEPNKLYHVLYTGWLASNGRKFDSTDDHPRPPQTDKDGKPVLGPDGKPQQGPPQPIVFPQGFGRVIPGWDQGFNGMHIGGKRRLFIPWQLAYGAKGRPGPDEAHPGIPPKADLIFDVELVEVTDMPMAPQRPPMPMNRPTPPAGQPPAGGLPSGGAAPPAGARPSAPVTPPDPTKPSTTQPQNPSQPAPQATPGTPANPAKPPAPSQQR